MERNTVILTIVLLLAALFIIGASYTGKAVSVPFDSDGNGMLEIPDLSAATSLLGQVYNTNVQFILVNDCAEKRSLDFCNSVDINNDNHITVAEAQYAYDYIKSKISGITLYDSDGNGMLEIPDLSAANNLLGQVSNTYTKSISIDDCIEYGFSSDFCNSVDTNKDALITYEEAYAAVSGIKGLLGATNIETLEEVRANSCNADNTCETNSLKVTSLAKPNGGNAYVCVNAQGQLYRSNRPCRLI